MPDEGDLYFFIRLLYFLRPIFCDPFVGIFKKVPLNPVDCASRYLKIWEVLLQQWGLPINSEVSSILLHHQLLQEIDMVVLDILESLYLLKGSFILQILLKGKCVFVTDLMEKGITRRKFLLPQILKFLLEHQVVILLDKFPYLTVKHFLRNFLEVEHSITLLLFDWDELQCLFWVVFVHQLNILCLKNKSAYEFSI